MSNIITTEEWLSELERLEKEHRPGGEGFSTEYLADKLGVGRSKARTIVKRLLGEGKMKIVKMKTTDMSGRHITSIGYAPVFSGGGKIKKK